MPYTEEQRREFVGRIDGLRADGKSLAAACREVSISQSSYRSWKATLRKASRAVVHRIFISHRHGDQPVADALRLQFLNWGFAEDQVFQSSHPEGGVAAGAPIRASLLKSILQAQLVILVFSYERHDWQYCMWEMGVAMGSDRHKRKVVVLRAFEDEPKVFGADKILRIDWPGSQKLVKNVHKDDDFFPNLPAFQPTIAAEAYKDKSKNLYKALKEAAEKIKITGGVQPRLQCGSITYHVDAAKVAELEKLEGYDPKKIRASLESAAVVVDASQEGLEHFGFRNLGPVKGKDIHHLVKRWKRMVGASDEWATDLCVNLYNAIEDNPREPSWRPFGSAWQRNTWVVPLVKLTRQTADGDIELDVDVYRMPAPALEALPSAA